MEHPASETLTHGNAIHWEGEACEILRASTSAEAIQLVCSCFPFQHPDTPLGILSSRRTENLLTDVDVLGLHKAEETLRTIATECSSCSWDWKWSLPFAFSTTSLAQAANDTDKDLLTLASKVTFMALERKVAGFPSGAVEDFFQGLTQVRRLLEYRFNELGVSIEEYEAVGNELENPLTCWIFSSSLRSTGGSPCPSDAFAPILRPIKELFENRELPLMSVLQRLKILAVLYQDILDGLDPRWEGLSEEDFSFLEDVTNHTPRGLARLLIEKDLSCSQKLSPNDFLDPAELRSKSTQWSRLVFNVRVCAKAHPDLVGSIDEAAKILLCHRNFFSGMALIYGLSEANHPPAELWWKFFSVRYLCAAYQVKGWLLRLPDHIEDDAGSKPTGAETKSGRSCMASFLENTSTLSVTLFGMKQYIPGHQHTSDGAHERKEELSRKEVDSMAGGSWNNGSTMAGSDLGPESEYGVEDVGGVDSDLVLSGVGSPVHHVNDTSHVDDYDHTEDSLGTDGHNGFDLDSGLGSDCGESTTTLTSAARKPVEKYGRTYHGYHEGKYLLPNDEQEQARLDLQHKLFDITFGGRLHLTRLLPTTRRALDIGTGTGIWSMDFADEHPDIEVHGVDLSPIQPPWVPPNCIFQVDDLSLPWIFDFPFDFIHGRMLFCSFSDPLHVFREAFKALAAGGVIEMQDLIFDFRSSDGSLGGSALETWAKKVKEAFGSKGIDLTSASRYSNYLHAVGFEEIGQKEFSWPVGTWPKGKKFKTLGWWCRQNILEMLFAISIVPLTEQHSMSREAVELLLVRVREDLRNQHIHAYLQIIVVHGRKPK